MSEIVVVKLGGTTLAEQRQVLAEVAAVARRRPIVLVHGGGKRMTEWLERLGIPAASRAASGSRTPRRSRSRPRSCGASSTASWSPRCATSGCDAVGLSGVDGGLLIGQRLPDVGLVATVIGVRRDLLDSLLVAGQVPVVAPLARDEEGVVCNVNADDAAAGIAAGLGARQLVLMTDVDGVRDANGRKLDSITAAEAEALIADGTIRGGMVPKVRAALAALAWDGAEAIIADAAAPDALVRALEDPTFGTRVSTAAARRGGPDRDDGQAGPPRGDPAPRGRPPDRQPGRAGRRAVRARLRGDPGHREPRRRGARPGQGHARRPLDLRQPRGLSAPRHGRRPTSGCGGSSPTSRSRSAGAG